MKRMTKKDHLKIAIPLFGNANISEVEKSHTKKDLQRLITKAREEGVLSYGCQGCDCPTSMIDCQAYDCPRLKSE